ncbi:multicopper oxidase domain-containing protein [Halospeciosus flavus]|uniref:Multicopper oxidase domain-containing protein n=1 Tax=Halospeciosus flavus TaxID=3032283 RepID=A0ABD5Z5E3_9EURY|nr:multicopper oxidase domain-containing protein [Halospeciosus flavus]
MTKRHDAAGGVSRREYLAATGLLGGSALAGCTTTTRQPAAVNVQPANVDEEPTSTPTRGYTAPPQEVDLAAQNDEVTLRTRHVRHAVHPEETMGGPIEFPLVWAFQADDREPSVPGPILRAREGAEVKVTLDNTEGHAPHTLHFHGSRKAWKDDGVPSTTGITVMPGEKHTYTIPANVPGTHLYHCHFQTHRHIDMGMYGVFRVDPKGYERPDREHFLTVKEWDSRLPRMMAGEDVEFDPRNRRPDVFTVNGKSAPRTLHPEDGSPIVVKQGDRVRLHLVNAGYMSHPMHLHNHRLTLVERDGGVIPEVARYQMDVTNVAPAQRHTVEFVADADPGIYPMHCHKVDHVMNGSFYPGGMLGGVVYEEAMDTDIFRELMEYAGAR